MAELSTFRIPKLPGKDNRAERSKNVKNVFELGKEANENRIYELMGVSQ